MKHDVRWMVASALVLATAQAHAGDGGPSPWAFRMGPAQVAFSTNAVVSANGAVVPGGNVSASDNTTLGFELSYKATDSITARFLAGVPPVTTLRGEGTLAATGVLGKATYAPAVASLTYHLLKTGPIQPYVGAGVNYTMVLKSEDGFISPLKVKSAWGSVLQAGVEVPLDADWSVSLDARKIFLKTKADGLLPAMGGATAHADVTLNPLVVLLSVGRRF